MPSQVIETGMKLTLRRLAAVLVLSASALIAPAAFAQGTPPQSLDEVRKAWAAAVLKNDAPAAAALAAFPLQQDAYQSPKTFGRAAYLQEVEHWSSLRTCLAREKMTPVKGRSRLGTHMFNCDGHGFFFAQRNGAWRHTGYENTNE